MQVKNENIQKSYFFIFLSLHGKFSSYRGSYKSEKMWDLNIFVLR